MSLFGFAKDGGRISQKGVFVHQFFGAFAPHARHLLGKKRFLGGLAHFLGTSSLSMYRQPFLIQTPTGEPNAERLPSTGAASAIALVTRANLRPSSLARASPTLSSSTADPDFVQLLGRSLFFEGHRGHPTATPHVAAAIDKPGALAANPKLVLF